MTGPADVGVGKRCKSDAVCAGTAYLQRLDSSHMSEVGVRNVYGRRAGDPDGVAASASARDGLRGAVEVRIGELEGVVARSSDQIVGSSAGNHHQIGRQRARSRQGKRAADCCRIIDHQNMPRAARISACERAERQGIGEVAEQDRLYSAHLRKRGIRYARSGGELEGVKACTASNDVTRGEIGALNLEGIASGAAQKPIGSRLGSNDVDAATGGDRACIDLEWFRGIEVTINRHRLAT